MPGAAPSDGAIRSWCSGFRAADFLFREIVLTLRTPAVLHGLVSAMLLAAASAAWAQQPPSFAEPRNVVQFSASASAEVPQDLLSITLNTTREAADAATVQAQLKAALDAALAEARKAAQPGQLDVRTGNFSLYPRSGRDGKFVAWQGSAELVLEGRDFARISATAGRIQTLTMGGVSFGLSREQRAKVESEVQGQAIEQFKARAGELAKSFGFGGYSLREVSVSGHDQAPAPRMRVMAMDAKLASPEAAVPVEGGKSTVTVTVSGSVQLK